MPNYGDFFFFSLLSSFLLFSLLLFFPLTVSWLAAASWPPPLSPSSDPIRSGLKSFYHIWNIGTACRIPFFLLPPAPILLCLPARKLKPSVPIFLLSCPGSPSLSTRPQDIAVRETKKIVTWHFQNSTSRYCFKLNLPALSKQNLLYRYCLTLV